VDAVILDELPEIRTLANHLLPVVVHASDRQGALIGELREPVVEAFRHVILAGVLDVDGRYQDNLCVGIGLQGVYHRPHGVLVHGRVDADKGVVQRELEEDTVRIMVDDIVPEPFKASIGRIARNSLVDDGKICG